MDKFFREVRIMLARELGARLRVNDSVMGEVVIEKINNDFIPDLTNRLSAETNPIERKKLEDVIILWKEYGDRKNQLSRVWNVIATNEVADTFRSLDDSDAQDAAQEIALLSWKDDWIGNSKFDSIQGPKRLEALWKMIIRRRSKHAFERIFLHKYDRSKKAPSVNEQGQNLLEQQPVSYSELEDMVNREVREDLGRYVHHHAKYSVQEDMFDAWQHLAMENGASNVDREESVYPALAEKYNIKGSRLRVHWKEVRGLILDYFKKELGLIVPTRVEKRLFRGSDEASVSNRIVAGQYRMELARWILEGCGEIK